MLPLQTSRPLAYAFGHWKRCRYSCSCRPPMSMLRQRFHASMLELPCIPRSPIYRIFFDGCCAHRSEQCLSCCHINCDSPGPTDCLNRWYAVACMSIIPHDCQAQVCERDHDAKLAENPSALRTDTIKIVCRHCHMHEQRSETKRSPVK